MNADSLIQSNQKGKGMNKGKARTKEKGICSWFDSDFQKQDFL